MRRNGSANVTFSVDESVLDAIRVSDRFAQVDVFSMVNFRCSLIMTMTTCSLDNNNGHLSHLTSKSACMAVIGPHISRLLRKKFGRTDDFDGLANAVKPNQVRLFLHRLSLER
jgi:hypothetical protein